MSNSPDLEAMRMTGLLLSALLAFASCERVEEPTGHPLPPPPPPTTAPKASMAPSSPTASSPTASGSTKPVSSGSPAASGSAATKPCLVETAKTPPPRARPSKYCPPDPTGIPDLPERIITFVDAPSQPVVEVELADTPMQRARGLMFRTEMAQNHGMLFSWDDEEVRSFWMRNTCLPLDMLFIARDGTIVGILEQVPTLNELSRSIPCPAAHVLELNAGWARAHKVRAGQKVRIR